MDVIRKLLPVVLGLQTVLCTMKYVSTPASWQNASAYCRALDYEVSCVPTSVEKKVWINLYTTFTSWFRLIACNQDSKIESSADKKFVIEEGDIGSCQLACYKYDYFATKQETCMCFKKLSPSRRDVTNCQSDDYEVFKKDAKSGFPPDPTKPCEYLYCNQQIPETGLLVRNLTTACNYSKDEYIAICDVPDATHRCLNYMEFQERNGSGDIDTDKIKCAAYKVECSEGGSPPCEKIAKPVKGNYKRRVGITSTLVHYENDTPVVTCGYLKPYYGIEFYWGKECKQQNLSYFCETDVTDLSCYKNNSKNIIPRLLHFIRKNNNIATTAAPNKLRTSEETTSAGTIVGVVVGLCLVSAVAVIAIVIITIRLRRRKNDKTASEHNGGDLSQVTPAVTNTAYEYGRGSISSSSHYDYIKEPQYYKIDSGYEELDIENNKECDYTDNLEYDHLHGKGERKANTSQQNNLYSHSIPDNDGSTYDKANATSNVIDHSNYNTATSNNDTDDDYNKLDVTKL